MVCKKWDWYIGAGSTRLPRKVLTRLHIVQRKVRFDGGVRSPIEVEITGKKDHDEFDFLLTAQDEDALCPELQHRILNTYVESFYMSSLVPTHFLLGSIAAAAGNIVVGKMALDGVSFSAVANSEFWNFIFGFKGISELDMEKAVILPQQLNNVFLGRAALKGVSRLRLPRAYPLRSNHYNFDFSGLTTFLRNAPADKGAIQLSAFYPDFTLEQATEVPRVSHIHSRINTDLTLSLVSRGSQASACSDTGIRLQAQTGPAVPHIAPEDRWIRRRSSCKAEQVHSVYASTSRVRGFLLSS